MGDMMPACVAFGHAWSMPPLIPCTAEKLEPM